MLLKISGTQATNVIFMADIWKPSRQWDSRYLWLSLEIGAGKIHLPQLRPWIVNVQTGEVSFSEK